MSDESLPLVLTFPMPRNIGNGGHYHWRTRERQRTTYLKTLDMLQAAGQIARPPATPLVMARLDSVMHLGAQMDVDNAMRRHKWVIDWLKRGATSRTIPRSISRGRRSLSSTSSATATIASC